MAFGFLAVGLHLRSSLLEEPTSYRECECSAKPLINGPRSRRQRSISRDPFLSQAFWLGVGSPTKAPVRRLPGSSVAIGLVRLSPRDFSCDPRHVKPRRELMAPSCRGRADCPGSGPGQQVDAGGASTVWAPRWSLAVCAESSRIARLLPAHRASHRPGVAPRTEPAACSSPPRNRCVSTRGTRAAHRIHPGAW